LRTVKTSYVWNKEAVAEMLDAGDLAAMEAAHWANPQPIITIRTK